MRLLLHLPLNMRPRCNLCLKKLLFVSIFSPPCYNKNGTPSGTQLRLQIKRIQKEVNESLTEYRYYLQFSTPALVPQSRDVTTILDSNFPENFIAYGNSSVKRNPAPKGGKS